MKKFLIVILSSGILFTSLLIYEKTKLKVELQEEPISPKPSEIDPIKKPSTFEMALSSIKKDELERDLYYLADEKLEGRMSGKVGNVVAADYINKKFVSYGLESTYDKFSIRQINPGPKNEKGESYTQNVYAVLEGSDPILKNEIVVVGAHMDHIGYGPSMSRTPAQRKVHPGADDNASGTVALLELSQAFSLMKGECKRTIVFQAYSAEEMGMIGSRHYCENPLYPKDNPDIKKHIFMLNMDMVGYLGKGEYSANFLTADSSLDVNSMVESLNNKYSFAKKITNHRSGGSDHASFYNKKIPVAFLHTGLHHYYHTPEDTPDKINYSGLEEITKYAFELVWKIANIDKSPEFNYKLFKSMDYDHDHGHSHIESN